MERKRRKEMEKDAREKARHGADKKERAAWRDELDSDEEEEEHRSEKERRERERDRGHGHSDRESRSRHIRSYRTSKSRSKSPNRVSIFKVILYTSRLSVPPCF